MEIKMPEYKSQENKAQSTINAQPKDFGRTIIHQLLERDVAGWTHKRMGEDLGLSDSRISIITRSPMYVQMRDEKLKNLGESVKEKVSDHIADAEGILKEAKTEAASTLVNIMRNGKSEAVKASVATAIVDRGREIKGGVNVVVQINEKLSERFDKVLKYEERGSTAVQSPGINQ
jgi:hypothetical protein